MGFVGDVALTRQFRDDDPFVIANQSWVNMLVTLLAFEERVYVHAPFVSKSAVPHVRLMGIKAEVCQFADIAGRLSQGAQLLVTDTLVAHLELEGRDDGTEIGLSVSVGIARFPMDAKNSNDVLAIADQMMYHAKAAGRGRVCFANELYK